MIRTETNLSPIPPVNHSNSPYSKKISEKSSRTPNPPLQGTIPPTFFSSPLVISKSVHILPPFKPDTKTISPQAVTAKDYRGIIENKCSKELVQQYLDTYFSAYLTQIQENDELLFKVLARLLNRELNLHNITSQSTKKLDEFINNRVKLNQIEQELQELNQQGSYKKARLFKIYNQLGEIPYVKPTESCLAPKYKISSLEKNNPLIPASLIRKIGFVATVAIKLFCRLLLRQDNWSVIKTKGIPDDRQLLLGSIPNSLSYDAETFKKNGVTAVLSLLEPFEHEKRSLSQPYTFDEWAKHGITQGWIEAKDHESLSPEQLDMAADFIHEHLKYGNVYVHCRGGCGRSNMAIAAYLMKYCDHSVEEAKAAIMGARRQSSFHKKRENKTAGLVAFAKTPKFQLMKQVRDQLKKGAEVLEKGNKELLLVARLADPIVALTASNIELVGTDETSHYIKITLDGSSYYAQIFKESPHRIEIRNRPDSLSFQTGNNFEEIKKRPDFLKNVKKAAETYITDQFEKEFPRIRYTLQVEKKKPRLLRSNNLDRVRSEIDRSFFQKQSAAYYLFLTLLTQTGCQPATQLINVIDWESRYFVTTNNRLLPVGDQFTAVKQGNTIEVTMFLPVGVLEPDVSDQPTPQGLLKVVHKMDISNPNAPTLSTKVSFTEETSHLKIPKRAMF